MASGSSVFSRFAHRLNDDGSVDSICLHCFRTVASKNFESALAMVESQHKCDPRDIIRLNGLTRTKGQLIEFVTSRA